jgi:uncharacterized membrane protein
MDLITRIIHAITQLHPPHAIVVHFPIALTGAGLFFILLALWKHHKILEQAAFANMSLAAVSTIVAAILGIRDNLVFYAGIAPNHVAKIFLAATLFLLTTVTAIVRWRKKDIFYIRPAKGFYLLAYFVSFSIAMVLGFMGGIIVFGF